MSAEAPERSSGRHLSIGEVLAQLRGDFPDITISKIRFLESQGLIDPERTPSGYRKFYPPDLERLRWILYQQRDHFLPLRVIKDRLDAYGPSGAPGTESGARTSGNGPTSAPRPVEPPPTRPERVPSPPPAGRTEAVAQPGDDDDDDDDDEEEHDAPAAAAPEQPPPAPPPSAPPRSDPPQLGLPEAPADPVRDSDRPTPDITSRAQHPAGSDRPAPLAPAPAPSDSPPEPPKPTAVPPPAPSTPAPPAPRALDGRTAPPPARPEPAPKPPPPFDDFVDDAEDRDEELGTIRRGDDEPTSTHMTRVELLEATGLTDSRLDALEEFGIITPLVGEGALAQYDDEALNVAEIGAGFYARGIEARHLKMYWHFAEREAALFAQVLIGYVRQRNPAARAKLQEDLEDLARLGRRLRTAMLRRALGDSLSE